MNNYNFSAQRENINEHANDENKDNQFPAWSGACHGSYLLYIVLHHTSYSSHTKGVIFFARKFFPQKLGKGLSLKRSKHKNRVRKMPSFVENEFPFWNKNICL